MKIGVIFFHRNIKNIYRERWIKKCVDSILNQTYSDFSIYEINYGGEEDSILEGFIFPNPHVFITEKKENHAEAMNAIIDVAFKDGCDYIFNTNLDDFYDLKRFEVQVEKLNSGFDLVSSDFCYVEEIGEIDEVTLIKNIKKFGDIRENLEKSHNVIAHPSVAYSRRFWEQNRYVPAEIPREDMNLWLRSIQNGFKFYICDEVLLNYRLHENQVTGRNSYLASQKKEEEEKKDTNYTPFTNPTLIR
jgi:glycosyltransferase involved in cell wall biosynthesis